jgi:signal transduction histidine kinase
MRFTIATKLFLGFLCVIGLNTIYLVIVYKINDINAIVETLKRTDNLKSRLLRLETLHRIRGTSIISYAKIGRQESVENFRVINDRVSCLIDTLQREMNLIINSDLQSLPEEQRPVNDTDEQNTDKTIQAIIVDNTRYTTLFESLVSMRTSPKSRQAISGGKAILDSLDIIDKDIAKQFDSGVMILREWTDRCIKQISHNVVEVNKVILSILTVLTLFSLVFGLIFSRTITNALRRLKESADRIGKSDFDLIPSGFPNDEIGDLAKALFVMSVDLRSKQEELLKSKRLAAIGEIVSSVNHEINNPLMIISGNAQFLEMSMEEYPADMKERVKTIIEETGRISEITRKLREIRNPVSQDYLTGSGQMIDINKSTQ